MNVKAVMHFLCSMVVCDFRLTYVAICAVKELEMNQRSEIPSAASLVSKYLDI